MGSKMPNGGRFQHAATFAAPLVFTAISNATEAVPLWLALPWPLAI